MKIEGNIKPLFRNDIASFVLRCSCHWDLCRVEHIFNENAVSRGRVIYKNVRDSPDELAVLDDGGA